jgi:hypothetical protein
MKTDRKLGLPIWALGSLALALCLPVAPAQASEVVKLARLIITGKRQPSRPPAVASQPAGSDRASQEASAQPQRTGEGELHIASQRRGNAEAALTMD